ncbi:hypothetical protein INR49_008822 [Caranx melampygus]|nr:hypothetical protein INR49_008822 [Caranx melampygus]
MDKVPDGGQGDRCKTAERRPCYPPFTGQHKGKGHRQASEKLKCSRSIRKHKSGISQTSWGTPWSLQPEEEKDERS